MTLQTIYYDKEGDAGSTLLFIHGHGGSSHSWDPQVNFFVQQGFQVLCPGLRGYGQSPLPEPPDNFTNTGDLIYLLDHLNISNAHVVGSSRGGRIATNLTLNHPDRVKSLALVSAALGGHEWSDEWKAVWPSRERAAREGVIWTPDWAIEEYYKLSMFTEAHKNPELHRSLQDKWHIQNWDERQILGDLGLSSHIPSDSDRLAEISVPTLVLSGGKDSEDIQLIAQIYAALIPGATHIIYPDLGHMIGREAPDLLNNALLAHLCATEPNAPAANPQGRKIICPTA